jgi:Uma2 family endonuclease
MSVAHRRLATADDLGTLERAEVVGGAIVQKAGPSFEHGDAQGAVVATLRGPFFGKGGSARPGGWWFGTEVEIELEAHEVYLPDVAGWRRDRVPERPSGGPVRTRPDWVCEVLSASTAERDLTRKFQVYFRAGVPHYWVLDPERRTLTVYRWQPNGYLVALQAAADERVRPEPFDAIEVRVAELFGDEEAIG